MAVTIKTVTDYTPTTWTPSMPITDSRMNNLETGVDENRDAIMNLNADVTSLDSAVADRPTTQAVNIMIQQSGAGAGQQAMTHIAGALGNTYTSLVERFEADESSIQDIIATFGQKIDSETQQRVPAYSTSYTVYDAITEILAAFGTAPNQVGPAYNSTRTIYNAINAINTEVQSARNDTINSVPYASLALHLNNIDSTISTLNSNVATILASTGLDDNEDPIPLATRMTQLAEVYNEIQDTHRNGVSNDSLLQRFSDDETAINNKISTANIENNLTTLDTTTGHVLDARQGRVIKELLYSTNDTAFNNTDDTVAARIAGVAARISSLEGDTLDSRLDTIEEVLEGALVSTAVQTSGDNTTYTTLDQRLEAIETDKEALKNEVAAAHRTLQSGTDSLDNRFDDLETAAAGLRTDVNTIANELAMMDNDALVTTNTRVDTLESDLRTMAAELNMLDGTAIVDTNTRIDGIETEINNAHRTLSNGTDTLDNRFDDIEVRATALEGSVNDATTGLTATKAIADEALSKANAAAVASDVTTALAGKASTSSVEALDTRVTALESKDTIVIDYDGINSNYTEGEPNLSNPLTTADYLIADDDDKYFYWRYFGAETGWQLVGGAGGGSGSSNAEDYETYTAFQSATPEENKDYYVLRADGIRHHYRYLPTNNPLEPFTLIEIGQIINTNNIKTYNLTSSTDSDKNYIDLYEFDYGISNSELSDGTRIAHIELVGGGGGGTMSGRKFTRITPRALNTAIGSDSRIELRYFYTTGTANETDEFILTQSNKDMAETEIMTGDINSGDPANASTSWPTTVVDGETVPVDDEDAATGFGVIDVTRFCNTVGVQTFTLTARDKDNVENYTTIKWEVNVINLTISSNFTQNAIATLNSNIRFTYIPSGDVTKIAHFEINGTEIGTQELTARTVSEQTYNIAMPQAGEGVYQLKAYLTASISGRTIPSEPVYRDLIWRDSESTDVILGSPYRGRTITVTQYDTLAIPYTIAGSDNSYTVQYFVDNMSNPVSEITVQNANGGTWNYKPLTTGAHTLRIKVDSVYIDINLNVTAMTTDIVPVEADLVLDFNPQGLNNNSTAAKNWTDGTYHLTTSNNFDWYNGGYGSDEDGEYFLVKSGTRAYFDYKMFMAGTESVTTQGATVTTTTSSVYGTGQEMKIIFKTKAVRSIDAVWFSNMGRYDANVDKEVGIQLNTHQGWLKTDTAGVVANEDEAVTNSYLYFPYSEEDRIELDINIFKEDPETKEGNFIMSYEDGVPSKAYAYTHNQKLYHVNGAESVITIGSDDCDTYIYRLRIYNNELSGAQILRNFIADGKDIDECIARYNRNCIYYDSEHDEYSPYADDNFILDPEALAPKIPNVKVLMLDAPSFTLNKKSFIKDSSLRCIHADGGTLYKSRGAADNWKFENGYHAGQGTTSDKYGDAGRNLDFLFNCDNKGHKPSDKVNSIQDYVSQVTTGYGTPQAEVSIVSDWKGDDGKISLTSTSVPNNFFNFKVNIASSENVNNALLQKRYNDFLPYISPASANQHAKHSYDSKVTIKNDMEFVPAVLFIRENDETISNHSEFKDTNWHYYALGNLGDSKKTDYTRAYDPDDMNEFTLEISDNNTNNSQFQTGVYMVNGEPTLETFNKVQDMKDDGVTPIAGSFTAQGTSGAIATTDYVFPLDTPELKAMWNAVDGQGEYTNKNHWSLVNEKYDGDHSFEMRYACCGDYRDGKLVNDTTGQGEAQLAINSKVWQAFYSWVVTSSNTEFVNELDQWCVRSAVEFWYAFTHYYTMMDNRAKNTFWHFAKTGKHRQVLHPLKDMLHTYDESSDAIAQTDGTYTGTFTRTEDTDVDNNKTYYTEYAFDLWDYDNDTALGINNNGELIFPYGKEDSDYTIDNTPESGFVFNGAGSVFWRRLRDLCTAEIGNIFTTVREQFFSAENLIETFDAFQECYPEALWQVDIQRKYIRPFTGESLDNSKERNNKVFLKSMMQGRKKYQRRQWIKDQYYYFGSKYKLGNVTEDFFLLDCYKGPDDSLIADLKAQGRDEEAALYVGSNWDITITPYQDMYINVLFGETAKTPVRAKAGQPVEMTSPFTDMNNTRIYIYGASRIQALAGKAIREDPSDPTSAIIGAEGLASLYIGLNQLQRTAKLRNLNLGTDKPTYRNTNFNELKLNNNNPILETLNIKNCGSLVGELDLSHSDNLRVLEAEGTNITSVLLPSSSQITTLHLPSTITGLTLLSARLLNSLSIKNKETGLQDYSNIRELLIDNSDYSNNINWITIARGILNNLNYVYLLNLTSSTINNISELEVFKVKRENASDPALVQLSGTVPILGNWSQVEKDTYGGLSTSIWPELNFDTTNGTEQIKCKVTYMESAYQSDAGLVPAHEIETRYISANGTDSERIIPDIYQGYAVGSLPQRSPTIASTYQFGIIEQDSYKLYSGWSLSQDANARPLSETYSASNPYRANTIVSEITLYTYYQATPHTYAVKWYLDDAVVKTVTNQSYGGGYTLEAPTVKELRAAGRETAKVTFNTNGTVTYKIFDGWQKLPTNITPSAAEASTSVYRIDAKWHEETVPLTGENGLFTNTSSPTLEQLLVLSRMDTNLRNSIPDSQNIVPTLKYEYQMGFEGTKTGVNILNTNNVRRFPDDNYPAGDQVSPGAIKPFSSNNGFTLVLDYKFDSTQTIRGNAAVLVGCYERNSGNVTGFALYNNRNSNLGETGIKVGYGDMFSDSTKSVFIHNPNQRNVVVIRHPANSSQLWIYSSAGSGNITSTTLTIPTPINVNTQALSNAEICLGNLRNDITSTNSTYTSEYNNLMGAQGTIYWARYWNEDLGAGECKQLAAWPHEHMTAKIAAIDADKTNELLTRPSIYLTNLTATCHGYVLPTKFSASAINVGNSEGWGSSMAKTICDDRIFSGLPIRLQSILSKPNIGYKNYSVIEGGDFTPTATLGSIESTSAFIYIPSISSLQSTVNDSYAGESILERTGSALNDSSDITPYTWMGDASSMVVYDTGEPEQIIQHITIYVLQINQLIGHNLLHYVYSVLLPAQGHYKILAYILLLAVLVQSRLTISLF